MIAEHIHFLLESICWKWRKRGHNLQPELPLERIINLWTHKRWGIKSKKATTNRLMTFKICQTFLADIAIDCCTKLLFILFLADWIQLKFVWVCTSNDDRSKFHYFFIELIAEHNACVNFVCVNVTHSIFFEPVMWSLIPNICIHTGAAHPIQWMVEQWTGICYWHIGIRDLQQTKVHLKSERLNTWYFMIMSLNVLDTSVTSNQLKTYKIHKMISSICWFEQTNVSPKSCVYRQFQ